MSFHCEFIAVMHQFRRSEVLATWRCFVFRRVQTTRVLSFPEACLFAPVSACTMVSCGLLRGRCSTSSIEAIGAGSSVSRLAEIFFLNVSRKPGRGSNYGLQTTEGPILTGR